MSTRLEPATVGGLFDILVCEIVDDQLLGEGVLTSVGDARRRLLTRDAQIIPRGATVYALPIECRIAERAGFALDDINLFPCDMALSPKAHTGCKLQHYPPDAYTILAPPLKLFDFDFAGTPVDQLTQGRTTDLALTFERGGVLSAFLIYFDLHCNPANSFSNGPSNKRLVAWDQNARYLPIEVHVSQGMRLLVRAEHDFEAVRVGVPQIHPEMIRGSVGHTELMQPGRGSQS